MKNKLPYEHMLSIALPVVELLRPRCKRIEIAGSLRRRREEIGDIEIVAEPNDYVLDLSREDGMTIVHATYKAQE